MGVIVLQMVSCTKKEVGPTSAGFKTTIENIEWPKKYYPDNSSITSTNMSVDLERESGSGSAWIWVSASKKQYAGDDFGDSYFSVILPVEEGPTNPTFNPGFGTGEQGQPLTAGSAVYRLRVGVYNFEPQGFESDFVYAQDGMEYLMYGGTSRFHLDADIEYIYQEDRDFLQSDWSKYTERIQEPYEDFPIGFVWKAQDEAIDMGEIVVDPPNYTSVRAYINAHMSAWSSQYHPPDRKYTTGLFAVDYFTYSANGAPISDLLGFSIPDFEASFVAAGQIEVRFAQLRQEAKVYVATHELAHVIGKGLTDRCDHLELHDSPQGYNLPCVMTKLSVVSVNLVDKPFQGCVAEDYSTLVGCLGTSRQFCSQCEDKLETLEHLLEDYSWQSFNPFIADELHSENEYGN